MEHEWNGALTPRLVFAFSVGIVAGGVAVWHIVSPAHRLFVAFCEAFVAAPGVRERAASSHPVSPERSQ